MTVFYPYLSDDCNKTSDVVCSSYQGPEKYSSAVNADCTVCKDTGCTEDLCCEKDGEPSMAFKVNG